MPGSMGDLSARLQSLVDTIDGLLAISFTDRDGNPMITAHSSTNSFAAQVLKSPFLTSLSFAADQGAKINIGRCTSVTFEYGNYTIVAFFYPKVTTVLVASSNSNIGQILDLEESLLPFSAILTNIVDQNA